MTRAVRARFHIPVCSFRDPMFPGVFRTLPVPPPSTVRGLLGAVTGRAERVARLTLGYSFDAAGGGTDLQTYHPVPRGGKDQPVRGRAKLAKGGATIKERQFLAAAELVLWVTGDDTEQVAEAFRRPVWATRLGRTEDLAHLDDVEAITLVQTDTCPVGAAVVPDDVAVDGSRLLRMPSTVSVDRTLTSWAGYRWVPPVHRERGQVAPGLLDPTLGVGVWFLG